MIGESRTRIRVAFEDDSARLAIESPGGSKPIEVAIVERSSNFVRAVVRLPDARFSLWSDRAKLYAVLQRAHRIAGLPGRNEGMFVELRAGARVKRLVPVHEARGRGDRVHRR